MNALPSKRSRFDFRGLLLGCLVCCMADPCLPSFADDLATAEEAAMQAAVDRIAASVVRIETIGGLETVDDVLISTAPTTGLIVSEDGLIASSAFNFIQKPASILVTLPDGQRSAAEIVAQDHSRHIVLLRADSVTGKLTVPEPTPDDEVRVGHWSLAIGRTFDSETPSVSVGVVSAVNRIWGRAIQTDCKVSPLNYGGPLVDIQGRVLGLLVPLSPQSDTEVAGAEWYDSGIGFAVPLTDIFAVLDRLADGEDLHRGLLGINVKGKNAMADPAIVAHAMPGSPAAKAGLKSSDKIIRLNDIPIDRHDDLKQAVGRKYAGEKVRVTALRMKKEIELEITLTDRIDPYELPYLGILPRRDTDSNESVVIRHVMPDSPAAAAALQAGDQLIRMNIPGEVETELESDDDEKEGESEEASKAAQPMALEDWYLQIADRKPGDTVQVTYIRDTDERTVDLKLGRQPESLPDTLPPAHNMAAPADPVAGTGLVEIKLPEEPNACYAYIPQDYDAEIPHGVVILLSAPGEFDKATFTKQWREVCEQHDLIVLSPQPADPQRWVPTEVDFIRKTLDDVTKNYRIDERRVVVHGHQAGGSLGYRFAFGNRDIIRGLAVVDATVPRRMQARGNDPIERLAIYIAYAGDSDLAKRISANVKTFHEFKFPVTIVEQTDAGYLSPADLANLARWIDTLDRL